MEVYDEYQLYCPKSHATYSTSNSNNANSFVDLDSCFSFKASATVYELSGCLTADVIKRQGRLKQVDTKATKKSERAEFEMIAGV